MINIWFLLLICMMVLIIYKFYFTSKIIKSDTSKEFFKHQCSECDGKQVDECNECVNCGYIIYQDGSGDCREGNMFGPSENDPDQIGGQWLYPPNVNLYLGDDSVTPITGQEFKDVMPLWQTHRIHDIYPYYNGYAAYYRQPAYKNEIGIRYDYDEEIYNNTDAYYHNA